MNNLKNKYFDISKPVFIPAAIITILFVSFTILFSKDAEAGFSGFQYYMSSNFGWFITLCINYFLIFVLYLAFSKFGNIRIGGKDAKPSFSKFSWVAMLFSAGMGIGLVYFSVAEPMLHFNNPVIEGASDIEKARL
ncbi:BCCT family transporter, partial [Marinilabilia sp.]